MSKQFTLKIKCTLLSELLGSQPADDKVFQTYVATKRPDKDKVESTNVEELIEGLEERGTTIFHRDDNGHLCLLDYQFKGFLKGRANAIRARKTAEEKKAQGWGAIKGKIDDHIFVFPRHILLLRNGEKIKEPERICERPLSAQTAQGDRICLSRSEVVGRGATFYVEIRVLGVVSKKQLLEILDDGEYFALGSWRNSGKGQISYEVVDQ